MITTTVEGSCRLQFSTEGSNVERRGQKQAIVFYFFKNLAAGKVLLSKWHLFTVITAHYCL